MARAVRCLGEASGLEPVPVLCADPVFLLSAGWRSGSTLLQRLITSDRRTLMWGEPYGDRIPIHRMAQMIEPYAERDTHSAYEIAGFDGALSESWIANLNPGAASLRAAHLAWFETLFAMPARDRGFERWGCKWVRLTAHHAHYLRWLYPQCRLVFLVRHPLAAYGSYRGLRETWYFERPDAPIRTAADFLGHWEDVTRSFASERDVLHALQVRHEDVASRSETVKELGRFLGSELDPGILDRNVGGTPRRTPSSWGRAARYHYWRRLRRLGADLGYDARGGVRDLPRDSFDR